MSLTRLADTAQVRAVNRDDRTIDVIASTPAVDSHGTRIDQSGWLLDEFKKNPVITWAHDDRGFTASGGRPIAKALPETVRVEDGKLKMRLKFPDKGKFPFADEVFELLADGFLNAVSVGFDPTKDERIENENGDDEFWFRVQKLLEVAVVTIPSNSEALAVRAAELKADEKKVRQRVEHVERLAEEQEEEPKEVAKEEPEKETVADAPADDPQAQAPVEKEEVDAPDEISQDDARKYKSYFDQKQPVNKIAVKVLEKFYKKVLDEKQPSEEEDAWKCMGEAIESMEEKEVIEEVGKPEQPQEAAPEETSTPTPPAEAPQEVQKASVQVPLSVLVDMPSEMTRSYVDAAVEALRRGIPVKDACDLIDGMNVAVTHSLTHIHYGENT